MNMCNMCSGNVRDKTYQHFSKSQKHLYNTGKVQKIHIRLWKVTLFPKAYEKHFQSDKYLVETGQKSRCDKCENFFDRSHSYECRKVEFDFCKTYYQFL